MRAIALVFSCSLLSACAGMGPMELNINSPYVESDVKTLLRDGKNAIKGSAFLRQNGGTVVTCAGSSVFLIPDSPYTAERLRQVYRQNINDGVTYTQSLYANVIDRNEPRNYKQNIKNTVCDQQGNFEFEKIADGRFYIQTRVNWGIGQYNTQQGYHLLQAVTIENGVVKKVILTRQ